ncbi:substrate-binding domain-containing protein [Sulfitobacter sp. M13]
MPMNRRSFITSASVATGFGFPSIAASDEPVRFGLTPVFLTNDQLLVDGLRTYLANAMSRPVELVFRRTYEEITALLVAGDLDAAWICGYPYLRNEDKLALLSVPVWNQKPLYQSYLIAGTDRDASDLSQLKGDVHAYSDPDSNSGYIVTQSELVARDEDRNSFFEKTFFTYGHRNVLRAVASGLAQSGSIDGYVWEAVSATEPDLAAKTKVVWKSEWFGFPPIACQRSQLPTEIVQSLQAALINMSNTADGMTILGMLQLDGFTVGAENLFDDIRRRIEVLDAAI